MKILLAVDDSEYSRAAMHALMSQFRPQNTKVCVLHVVEVYLADFEGGMQAIEVFETVHRERMEQAKKLVARFEKALKRAGYSSNSAVAEGSPKASVVEFAKKWRANLIFVGSHGRKGWKRLTLGSVSEAVARHAHCSVEIVRTRSRRLARANKSAPKALIR
jgi:nucleotide-binding universal stress UspA family protein